VGGKKEIAMKELHLIEETCGGCGYLFLRYLDHTSRTVPAVQRWCPACGRLFQVVTTKYDDDWRRKL
jgi:hypothetical protein